MSAMTNMVRPVAVVFIAGALAGCSKPVAPTPQIRFEKQSVSVDFAPPTNFTATLSESLTAELKWEDTSIHTEGYFVEYKNPGDESFVILDITHRDTKSFRHPDLAPETKFIYRIRPYFGKPTEALTITTGQPLPDARNQEEEGPVDADARTSAPDSKVKSMRSLANVADAAPTRFAASLPSPTSVILRWRDNASDEDGFLLECAIDSNPMFKVCALLPPNTTSFRKIMLPAGSKCHFRVRAFFYGGPTPLAEVTTPAEMRAAAADKVAKPGS